jgi:hypothetical protein
MRMEVIARFTSEGSEAWEALLLEYKARFGEIVNGESHPAISAPARDAAYRELLTKIQELCHDVSLAPRVFGGDCRIQVRSFANKLEGAEFFYQALYVEHRRALADAGVSPAGDSGLLNALDALFAEHTLKNYAGNPFIGELGRHIFAHEPRRSYRHLIGGPAEVYSVLHDEPLLLRTFMVGPFESNSDPYEQLAGRRDLITDRAALRLASRLYLDPATGQCRPGVASYGVTGGLRDFGTVHSQLSVTKHVRTLEPEKLAQLLPEEFASWKAEATK